MSVRKFWVAGDPHHAIEYTADVNQDALQPIGAVRNSVDESLVDPESLSDALVQAVHIASLCNVAT